MLTLIGRRLFTCPLAGIVLAGLIVSSSALASGYIPAEGCYLGAYIQLDHNSGGDLDRFEEIVGVEHASYFRYVGYGSPFPFRWVREMHQRGILPHIAWEPNDGLDPVQDDDYLRGWMEAAARTEGPIFLRYASEMNGTWQAYSGDPEEYIEKWKLVTRVARELAPNVIMVWCPFATPQSTIDDYYPGDAWVDWVGVNIYSVHHYDGDVTKPAIDDPRDHLRYVYDLHAATKPIAICEYAATHHCAACDHDVTDFGVKQMTKLYESLQTEFPRVKMVTWFSVDTIGTGLANNNYSLTCSPEFLERYREMVSNSHFLGRLPDVSAMVASLPPLTEPAESTTSQEEQPFGPLEVPEEPEVEPPASSEPEPSSDPTGEPPPTEHPLALARLGAVAEDDIDVAVVGAPPGAMTGEVEVQAEPGSEMNVDVVAFYVDGDWRAITNARPFRYPWDTSYEEPGVHEITVVGMNAASLPVIEKTLSVVVAEHD
jgi:hypothetical protein